MPGKHYDLDTDVTLSGNDDKVIASQKATKTYVDTEVDKKADPTIIRDTNSDISVKELVINRLTNDEYEVAVKEDDQLYLTPDTTDQDIADAINEHNTSNSAHSTLFNAKQDKLTTQTAYSSKGTASKVPQITTNNLGQVTNITEVDIAHQSIKTLKTDNTTGQTASSSETIAGSGTINLHKVSKTGSYNDLLNKPSINNNTITIQKNSTTVDSFTLNQSTDKSINISVPTTVAELSDSSNYVQTSSLEEAATVAKTGDYNDLINKPTIPQGTVTSVRVQATSPIISSQNTAQTGTLNTTISLANAYGDTKNPYGNKNANYVLAGPTSGSAAAPSFRALTKADIPLASETAASGGSTTSLVTTGEKYTWNSKQDALATQTTYTSKGSATKVPQITTNSLGQVTGITEVTISQPTVNNKTITIQKNSTTVDSFTLNQSTDKTINITVPTKTSDITNDSGFLTSHQDIKTLKTDNTTTQSTSASEALTGSGTINLHKIAKTGTFSDLLSKPTSISGYGITDAYTKTEVDGMISSVYKPAGSVAFASLPALSNNVLGNVYNVTDAFTTTANFVEGAGKSYPAGTNVVVVNTGTTASPTYKFDVLAGFVDLSGYVPTSRKVNGKALSADITISKSDVGLGNVDNTSDSDKPISTATQTALDGKENTISDLNKIRSGANSFYVKGTQTASTNAFTGVLSAVDSLYEGLTIDYWLPFAGTSTAATLNLTLAGGTTTGAVNCYYAGTTRLTTHLSANCVGRLIYQTVTISGTSYTGWWLLRAYYTEGSNTYDREYDNYYRGYAGMALPKYGLLMKGVNGRLYSLTATYETAATKVVTTVGLRPDLIWWNNSNATTNTGAAIKAQALYRSMPSTAGSSVFNASVPTYCDIYLCGDYDENTGLFYLATTDANGNASVTDYYRFVPYNTEPIYSNYFITGRYYIFVGSSYSTANYYHLMNQHPMYYFDGTNLINAADKPKYAATFVDWSE